MSTISFRPLESGDFARLARWQSSPHVARWWRDPADLASIAAEYGPVVDGCDPTEVFVIHHRGQPMGIIQRYRVNDYPAWGKALDLEGAIGIDYYLGDERVTGRGLGSQVIGAFARDTLSTHRDVGVIVAAPQQENVASWRALEKAGFERLWSGQLDSDDPSDAGPAYVYVLRAHRSEPSPRHPNYRERSSLPTELRRTTVSTLVQQWVTTQTGAKILRARRLAGASSTAVHGLYLSDGRRLVLRRYAWPGFLQAEPLAPGRELDALQFASRHRLAVPDVVGADVTGDAVGDGVPVLLMTFLPGRAIALPDTDRLAQALAAIHEVDPAGFAHDYFPWFEGVAVTPPPASSQPALWEKAIGLWRDAVPPYQPTFIHRDFHPGNVLWSRRRLSGVVDWANACRGPRGCDVATCHSNLVEWAGADAARRFVAAYESLTGEPFNRYWEMVGILENEPSAWTPRGLATYEPRLARAVAAISE
jgi:RimJ/RimL family protein N-acetyltransferase/aminoglycoside phosphotransferase (APT) family kinase protein